MYVRGIRWSFSFYLQQHGENGAPRGRLRHSLQDAEDVGVNQEWDLVLKTIVVITNTDMEFQFAPFCLRSLGTRRGGSRPRLR